MTDLQQRMENKSAKELIEILEFHQEDYTTEALQIAFTVLDNRKLSLAELNDIRAQINLRIKEDEVNSKEQNELYHKFKSQILNNKLYYSVLLGTCIYFCANLFDLLYSFQYYREYTLIITLIVFRIFFYVGSLIAFYKKHKAGWIILNGVFAYSLLMRSLSPIGIFSYSELSMDKFALSFLTPFLNVKFYLVLIMVLALNTKIIRTLFKVKSPYLVFVTLLIGFAIELIEVGIHWVTYPV